MQQNLAPDLVYATESPSFLGVFDLELADFEDLGAEFLDVHSVVNPLHPSGTRGTRFWHEAIALLRDKLLQRGWSPENINNQPRVTKLTTGGRKLSITFANGDNNTGTLTQPKTGNRKGKTTRAAISNNSSQMSLDLVGGKSHNPDLDSYDGVWFVLAFLDEDEGEIRLEISKPVDMYMNKPTKWAKRIIIPSVPLRNEPLDDQDGDFSAPSIDIPISPKSGT